MTSLQQPETQSSDSTFLLHGVFAVRDARDGYALVEVQQGVVTVLDVGSITVTSPDGFAKSYQLPAERADELAGMVGSRVTVMVDAEGRTLVEIGDPPIDGSDTAALVPIWNEQQGYEPVRTPSELPSAAAGASCVTDASAGPTSEPPTAAR